MDIQSLYTGISYADGLKALCFFLSHRPVQFPSTITLIRSTELVLTLILYLLSLPTDKGMAMGTHMGPSCGCLLVGYMEQSRFRCYTGTTSHLFLCYIDDCIGAALCSHEEREQFINFTNTFHPNLKVTRTISDTSLLFLDLSISGNCLKYFKPTDSHSYYISSHPSSYKKAIPYSQFVRICSQDGAFHSWTFQMSSYFKDRNIAP
eukprot:g40240.t1